MFGIDDAAAGLGTAVSNVIGKALDKIFPDPSQKAQAQALIDQTAIQGEIAKVTSAYSVMLAEANSSDKWTSRARPSFMYVMYIMILAALPMGVVSAFRPDIAAHVAEGLQAWLKAIPDGMWATFGLGYGGYAIARSYEKVKGVSN